MSCPVGTTRKNRAMAAEKKDGQKSKESLYEKRKSTILRKSRELSVLCDIKVCVVILSPDGRTLETWPESLPDVTAAFRAAAASDRPPRPEKRRRRNPPEPEAPVAPEMEKNAAEEDAGAIVVAAAAAGKRTEQNLDLAPTGCCGNLGFPAGIGEYYFHNNNNNHSYPGNHNYVGDPSCSSSGSYGFENQILPHHHQGYNGNSEFGEGMMVNNIYYDDHEDPLWVQPLQSMGNPRFGGDYQFGNYYYPYY